MDRPYTDNRTLSDGLKGLLCKKHVWQALKVRCDAKPKLVTEEVRREKHA